MDEGLLALARLVVSSQHWRWMPGMLLVETGFRVLDARRIRSWEMQVADDSVSSLRSKDGKWILSWYDEQQERERQTVTIEPLPDLTDVATLGCLLALVRDIYPGAHAEPNGPGGGADEAERLNWWAVYAPGARRLGTARTEAEALVAAITGAAAEVPRG